MKAITALLLLLGVMPRADTIDAEKFDLDRAHSEIGFAIRFMGLTNVHGRFKDFGGTIMYVERDVTRSSVSVLIRAKSIDTGVDMRDHDLVGPSFFNADSFPTIFFQSERIERAADGFVAKGSLTMRGVTKPVAIPFVMVHGKMKDAWGNTRIGFAGALRLARKDFGITGNNFWNSVVDLSRMALADTVEIELNVQAEQINFERISFGAQPGKKSLGAALMETYTARGLGGGAVTAQYALLKRDSAAVYSVGEGQLNTLAYKVMQQGRIDDAIVLFKLNVDAFPQSGNVYDSLGEAYLRKGDRANALAAYQKALALDPQNVGAMEVVRWLEG